MSYAMPPLVGRVLEATERQMTRCGHFTRLGGKRFVCISSHLGTGHYLVAADRAQG